MKEEFEFGPENPEFSGEMPVNDLPDAAENGLSDLAADMDFGELADLFGSNDTEVQQAEQVELTQDLEGFASCFPEWDLHPPVKR